MNNLLKDKNILIMGVANKWSIAWAIAKAFHEAGARLAFTYQGERSYEHVKKLTQNIKGSILIPCDVTKDDDIKNTFEQLKEEFKTLDGVIHSIAHARKEELEGLYINTSREGYLMAQDISAYSLVSVTKHAKPLMTEGGSIVALTYLGGERVVKNYNVMGVAKAALEASVKYLAADLGRENIRINAISAGPIKTLAAKGIRNFNTMLKEFEEKAPIGRLVKTEEVANTALFLCSFLSSGITGEVIHVDGGYNILGY
ncbi:enoyl-ACP reductase FabI [Crassaminicella thermophila]|uniref:Enoyl-[acyl-carrier-protein] reductase [NADH] n=1 Tax=Crassaminicella thermophila TaxID=2599308 RepID=A0A5C0SE15_CRATE|nr:enoyl-ACP reductase FabI [Crassaminicella thermophila]QEK12825.1 enoyl-ACP reductase FabI [Crassaminicella thermophila]